MNDLTTQELPKGLQEPGVVAGAKIMSLIPTTLEGVWRMANIMIRSPFVPKDLSTAEACASAIMLGLDVGLNPIQAVQSIAVINGRPSIWGDAALALCLSNPLCEDVIEEFSGDLADETTWLYTCTAKRKGRSKATITTFSYADAKTAGLLDKAGPWKQYRRRMIQLRARAFALRDAFPDILKGLAIREEMEDVDHTPARGRGADTPRPPGSEITDAEVREIPPETAKPVEPEKQPDAVQAEKQPEDKPRAKRKPNGWAALLEEAKFAIEDGVCVKDTMGTYAPGDAVLPADQDDADLVLVDNVITRKPGEAKKETPVEAVVRMLNAAPDLIALDQVVTTDSKGKPTEGSKLYDKMSPEEKETVKEAYRRRKVELGGVPKTPPKGDAQQQDQQQGEAGQQQSAEDEAATLLFGQIVKLFAEAKDTDTLDACMNQFDEQISDMPKQMRDAVEDLYTKAQARLAEASAKGDGQKDHVVDTGGAFGGAAEKDPATMTIDEYVAYAEAYIANAQSADWLKKRFFGENGIRQDLKLPNDISNRLRALRTAKGDELNAAGKV